MIQYKGENSSVLETEEKFETESVIVDLALDEGFKRAYIEIQGMKIEIDKIVPGTVKTVPGTI